MLKKSICSIIKDEQLYLKEWIDWHLSIGFDAIHLFEDMGSKSHEDIVKDYPNVYLRRYETDEEVKELLKVRNTTRQTKLYNWFANTYKDIYDWVAFIDLDEFFMFSNDYNLDKLCNEFNDYTSVSLSWKMMGASGHINHPNCGVMQAYTNEEPVVYKDKRYAFKPFCNLKNFKELASVHYSKGCVNTNHSKQYHILVYDKAWINHYFTKSWEDWCDRIFKRGGTVKSHRFLSDFFENNKNMNHLRGELIESVSHKIPSGTYYIDRENGLIAGGNLNEINNLNK